MRVNTFLKAKQFFGVRNFNPHDGQAPQIVKAFMKFTQFITLLTTAPHWNLF